MIVTKHVVTRSVFRRKGWLGAEYASADDAYFAEAEHRYHQKRKPVPHYKVRGEFKVIERYARWLRRADEREVQP